MMLLERIVARVVVTRAGCWEWTGAQDDKGYGQVRVDGCVRRTHQVTYEATVGPIPTGLEPDHLCRNRLCCNPAHLEPVTHQENCRRRTVLITECPQGHRYDEKNTRVGRDGRRDCRACDRERKRRQRAGLPAAVRDP